MQKEYKIRNNKIFRDSSDTGYKIRDNNKIYKDCVYAGYKIKKNYIYGDGTKIFG